LVSSEIVSANQSNVTAAQLEEWQATWRYFDVEGLNVRLRLLDNMKRGLTTGFVGAVYPAIAGRVG
jgi:hypothetical protein